MGVSFSCPFAVFNDIENGLESVIVKSISLGDEQVRTPVRSISFNHGNLEPIISKSLGSGKMTVEASVSFKGRDFERMISVNKSAVSESVESNDPLALIKPSVTEAITDINMAALKLQKVYKSFRTRRKLADCAVLVEQSWWKLLDFAELKRSSISFFEIKKHETPISRWSRARTRAAKVGKGLSKNDKAQKLALQHWLEAIDPRHRYGHNLHFYYDEWLNSQSREPFFYWLDIGEGKEVNLVDKCPRMKLQQQFIKYLGPMERMAYEVVVLDGKFFYKQSGELLNTTEQDKDAKWIFVLSTSKVLYVGKKKRGSFQHSSFLAGGATTAAGRLVIENGILKAVWPHSGHYRPTEQNFNDFVSFLRENNVELKDVQMSPVSEEDYELGKQRSSLHVRNSSSDEDLTQNLGALETEAIEEDTEESNIEDSAQLEVKTTTLVPNPSVLNLSTSLPNLEIPKKEKLFRRLDSENLERTGKQALSSEEDLEENEVEEVPEESILKRINSRKGTNSYQLGKQLSCRWTTGAGPRIGCVRDYPSELQFRALEKVNLSPRSVTRSMSYVSARVNSGFSPNASTTMDSGGEVVSRSSPSSNHCTTQSSPSIRGL